MGFLILLIINLVIGFARALVVGACIAKVWGWFITPVFKFMPALDFRAAVGLTIALGFVFAATQSATNDSEEMSKKSWTELALIGLKHNIAQLLVFPLSLFIAFLWHLYLG